MSKSNKSHDISQYIRPIYILILFAFLFTITELKSNIAAVITAFIITCASTLLFLINENDAKRRRQADYDENMRELLTVSKATYTAIKKETSELKAMNLAMSSASDNNSVSNNNISSDDLNSVILAISQLSETSLNAQVTAIKGVVKYNKENARAICANLTAAINSLNDNLNEKMSGLEKQASDNHQNVSDVMLQNAITMSDRLEGLAAEIDKANVLLGNMNNVDASEITIPIKEKINEPIPEISNTSEASDVLKASDTPEVSNAIKASDTVKASDFTEASDSTEPSSDAVVQTPKPALNVTGDPNRSLSAEEIAALFASAGK
jgi:hypothetical protein